MIMFDLKGFEIFIVLFNEFQTPRGYSLEGDQRCHGSDVTGTWFEPIPVSLDISHTLYGILYLIKTASVTNHSDLPLLEADRGVFLLLHFFP